MLSAYFDAAGKEYDQEHVLVAGFVAPTKMWEDFDKEWTERLRQDGLSYFHMVEFAHSKGEFKNGWRDDEPRRQALLRDLIGIILSHISGKFVTVVEVAAFKKQLSEEIKRQFLIKSYSLAGRTCAARIREWMKREWRYSKLEMVFEEGDEGVGALKDILVRDGFPEPLFKPKRDRVTKAGELIKAANPLQAADFLAYEYFLAAKRLSEKRWAFKHFSCISGRDGIYTVSNLKELEANFRNLRDSWLNVN